MKTTNNNRETSIVRKQAMLQSTIESTYRRMATFGPEIQCEMQVRYSLVDPILRAIGWRLEDPNCVLVDSAENNARSEVDPIVRTG